MPGWAVVLLVIASVLAVAGIGAGVWFGWRAFKRRALMRIVVRVEAVEAAVQALNDIFDRLAVADDDGVGAFISDPESPERRALHELALKADMVTDELDRMRLPNALVAVAESVADAAYLVSVQSRVVGEGDAGVDALRGLGELDLDTAGAYTAQARRRVHEACLEYGLQETNVYGGGLYL